MSRALLIVDVQNDFTEGGSLAVTGGARVAREISRFIAKNSADYALILASRDWHDADNDNGGHFASGEDNPDYVTTWPVHCVADTDGADYHPELNLPEQTLHIYKGQGIPAYSAFEGHLGDSSGTVDPGASDIVTVLRDAGITGVDIVGIATDHCVLASGLDARTAGFGVRVFGRLTAGVAEEPSRRALDSLREAGAVVSDSE